MNDILLPGQQNSQPVQPGGVRQTDTLMQQLSNALNVTPIGTHYQPSAVVPDMTIAGGYVPTVRRYTIIVDKILIPYQETGGAVLGRDGFLSGDVNEADLRAARCNIPYLIAAGHIMENGFMRI